MESIDALQLNIRKARDNWLRFKNARMKVMRRPVMPKSMPIQLKRKGKRKKKEKKKELVEENFNDVCRWESNDDISSAEGFSDIGENEQDFVSSQFTEESMDFYYEAYKERQQKRQEEYLQRCENYKNQLKKSNERYQSI